MSTRITFFFSPPGQCMCLLVTYIKGASAWFLLQSKAQSQKHQDNACCKQGLRLWSMQSAQQLICTWFPDSFCFHLQDLSRPINMPTTGKGGRGRGVESRKASPSAMEMASREGKRSERARWQVGREEQEKLFSPTAFLLQQPPNSPQVPEQQALISASSHVYFHE